MSLFDNLFEGLEHQGWAVRDDVVAHDLAANLYGDSQESWQAGLFHEAGIGRGEDVSHRADIRGDSILWLESCPQQPARQDFLAWTAVLRRELNERYFLGLKSEEFHFSRYPVGTGYRKHLDQHRSSEHRKISLVLYLNPEWSPDDAGELCIYSPEDASVEVQKIMPRFGRLVVFRSDLIPHEVLPCRRTRWALTGWFRTDA